MTIKLSPSDKGIAPVPAAQSPRPGSGVGDSASYGANGDEAGYETKLLVVDR